MKLIERFASDLSSRRAQHVVYLLHVWVCVPFLVWWVFDPRTKKILEPDAFASLRWIVVVTLAYMFGRTWVAYKDPPNLRWWVVFPPIDVALITSILCVTRLGPMSNLTLLYFLPIVQASGTTNVRWTLRVGWMVILGTVLTTLVADPLISERVPTSFRDLLADPLNVGFRILFLLSISSLMAYQALIAAGYRERLGVEADRNRIAMEMHDGVQGHLISIASQLELISRVAEKNGTRASELASEGRENARQAADELRFLVQRLRTPALSSGFVPALRQYAHNICERHQLRLVFEVTGVESTTPELENALFRIAQESLANVVKHAKAQSVSVSIEFVDSTIRLVVSDDGVGFERDGSGSGVGLEGMKWRADSLGGELAIESGRGKGTRIEAKFRIGVEHV
ncbi:MAG: sensor histidine kinase [Fimbriimonas sp.]|nr:sensor histidine kinase [Fimbriimonas sp.]